MSISDYEQFNNPNLERYHIHAPALGDSVRLGLRRTDDTFREVVSRIHERNPKSNLNNMLSRNP